MMQGFVWDCSTEQEAKPFLFPEGATLQAVALAELQGSQRSTPLPASALCVAPNVVLVGMPLLKRGRVLFLGAPGATIGDDPARLFSLQPVALSLPLFQYTFRAFLERLGLRRHGSMPRCSAVDAVFAIRIEQFSPSQPQAAESDDESYEDHSEGESSVLSGAEESDKDA